MISAIESQPAGASLDFIKQVEHIFPKARWHVAMDGLPKESLVHVAAKDTPVCADHLQAPLDGLGNPAPRSNCIDGGETKDNGERCPTAYEGCALR